MARELPGVLLVDVPAIEIRGDCNHTGRPIPGSVLVVETLRPDLYDAIVASSAVICAGGGRTGHMESLCRTRGIPVLRVERRELAGLVGTVTVRTDRESVVVGDARPPALAPRRLAVTPEDLGSICVVVAAATDVASTNALVPRVEQVSSFFVREEFVCLSVGLRPLDALRSGPVEARRYGAAVGRELCGFARELLPGQRLVMRLLDLRSDDAARITTGAVDHETNPDLGLHGARALLREPHYPLAFEALRAQVRDTLGPDAGRVGFAVPFVNDQHEYLLLRRRLALPDDLPLAVFVETPAAVHSVPGFCAAGASELFVGTKDLVQFYLAADRSNHQVAHAYQTRHPAVLAGLRQVVNAAGRAGTPVHVYALLDDLDHYAHRLPPDGFMMCTAELRRLAGQTGEGLAAA
ncbi:PEP-utilizing protein [Actinophytocola xinjiangensis]|uniref:PEP-utilizing protein n=1 Tax=Actinophytocola xinjiangensis TaxID=485602 RepID=A0A7Z0WQJ1_9PSEU|nr:putative PEP-binding protein [Actinophytocola xinjiangensis]OLF10636.1 PEP-utilizing protein [Actinophytocola xinjiangensis]